MHKTYHYLDLINLPDESPTALAFVGNLAFFHLSTAIMVPYMHYENKENRNLLYVGTASGLLKVYTLDGPEPSATTEIALDNASGGLIKLWASETNNLLVLQTQNDIRIKSTEHLTSDLIVYKFSHTTSQSKFELIRSVDSAFLLFAFIPNPHLISILTYNVAMNEIHVRSVQATEDVISVTWIQETILGISHPRHYSQYNLSENTWIPANGTLQAGPVFHLGPSRLVLQDCNRSVLVDPTFNLLKDVVPEILWKEYPKDIAWQDPFLLAFHNESIDVILLSSNHLCEKIFIKDLKVAASTPSHSSVLTSWTLSADSIFFSVKGRIGALHQITPIEQVRQLLSAAAYDIAYYLCRVAQVEISQDVEASINFFSLLLQQNRYEEAFIVISTSPISVLQVIAMLPELTEQEFFILAKPVWPTEQVPIMQTDGAWPCQLLKALGDYLIEQRRSHLKGIQTPSLNSYIWTENGSLMVTEDSTKIIITIEIALLRTYLLLDSPLLVSFLRLTTYCPCSVVEKDLKEFNKRDALIEYYKHHKLHTKAISLLNQGAGNEGEWLVDYLDSVPTAELVQDSQILDMLDSTNVFVVLANPQRDYADLVALEKLLKYLKKSKPVVLLKFIEYIMDELKIINSNLVSLRIESILEASKQDPNSEAWERKLLNLLTLDDETICCIKSFLTRFPPHFYKARATVCRLEGNFEAAFSALAGLENPSLLIQTGEEWIHKANQSFANPIALDLLKAIVPFGSENIKAVLSSCKAWLFTNVEAMDFILDNLPLSDSALFLSSYDVFLQTKKRNLEKLEKLLTHQNAEMGLRLLQERDQAIITSDRLADKSGSSA